jgi:hypothetical protein
VSRLDPREVWIGEALVDALNDDGYLTESVADIARSLSVDLPVTEDDVEQVLAFIHTLDPAGVGARNAAECICLQLAQLEPATTGRDLALAIARDHLQHVADRNFIALRRLCDGDEDLLQAALSLIRGCNPRPGSAFAGGQAGYIVGRVRKRTDQGLVGRDQPPQYRGSRTTRAMRTGAIGRLRHAACAAAGGALADPQPRDPQRDAAQGRALDRAAPVGVPGARRRSDAADDPARRAEAVACES